MNWRSSTATNYAAPTTTSTTVQEISSEELALSISDQRTIYLVNTFISQTVRFLNRFSSLCEEKLADVHRRMVHLDSTLMLLEAKLRSIDRPEDPKDGYPSEQSTSFSEYANERQSDGGRSTRSPEGSVSTLRDHYSEGGNEAV